MDQSSSPDYEFEGFRLDTAQQVLVSPAGDPLQLPSRAFATLRYLIEHSGELVEKSALMQAVWPTVIVEENNLNQCILTLRKVLGEVAGERRFILTVPGRGFKFVAPVRAVQHVRSRPPANDEPLSLPQASPEAPLGASRGEADRGAGARSALSRSIPILGAAAVVALASALLIRNSRERPVTSPAEYQALTDVADTATAPILSADGRMLAFIRGRDPFLGTGQIWLKVMPNGEPVQLTRATTILFAPTFTPDGSRIAYSTVQEPREDVGWDTWTVPVTGGEPTRLLPNATSLTYIGAHEVMYSEFKSGMHLGIVTSREDRSAHKQIYLPDHVRGMAHFSYLSPDRRSVLVVEMNGAGNFDRCRLVPFDGSTLGKPVGPSGVCISAAWSVDGKWMYFSVFNAGHWHLWRQAFPDGEPRQITFGPTDEETVSVAPDGRSLLTSVGLNRTTIWMHDGAGERVLTTESHAWSPSLSEDGRRLYFLAARGSIDAAELWRLDVASGKKEALMTGSAIKSYVISYDEREVVFTVEQGGVSEIWTAPLDRHAAPSLLLRGGDQVALDRQSRIFFRSVGAHANYVHRMNADGHLNERVLATPIVELNAVSPGGDRVAVTLPVEGGMGGAWLMPLASGTPRLLARGWWPSSWSRDGKLLYVDVGQSADSQERGRTAVLHIGTDGLPIEPRLPDPSAPDLIPHSEELLSIGPDPSIYSFVRSERRSNIYRIPLH
jgi:DNA-binding winged helix-turn-helix (wHTH) protein/Tol biopolymer transport system component